MSSVKFDLQNLSPGLAVDIDETLSWTIGYWVERLQKLFGNPEGLSVSELIKKYRYTQNVPYWQSAEAIEWMDKHRGSNEVQEELPIIEGSSVFLNKISEVIPISVYLTIRPKKVISGTKSWLDKHNFPKAPVVCCPDEVPFEDKNKWKTKFLKDNYPVIKGVIDDNPEIFKFIDSDYKGTIFLYDHAPINAKLNVIACKDWEEVYKAVKKHCSKS